MPWVTGDAAISKRAVANFTLDFFVCVVLICGLCPCRFGIFLLAPGANWTDWSTGLLSHNASAEQNFAGRDFDVFFPSRRAP